MYEQLRISRVHVFILLFSLIIIPSWLQAYPVPPSSIVHAPTTASTTRPLPKVSNRAVLEKSLLEVARRVTPETRSSIYNTFRGNFEQPVERETILKTIGTSTVDALIEKYNGMKLGALYRHEIGKSGPWVSEDHKAFQKRFRELSSLKQLSIEAQRRKETVEKALSSLDKEDDEANRHEFDADHFDRLAGQMAKLRNLWVKLDDQSKSYSMAIKKMAHDLPEFMTPEARSEYEKTRDFQHEFFNELGKKKTVIDTSLTPGSLAIGLAPVQAGKDANKLQMQIWNDLLRESFTPKSKP